MIRKTQKYIAEVFQLQPKTKLLIAVSGGIDSVVMLHILTTLEFECVVAHCNFGLRGAESDGDQAFVEKLSSNLNLPLNVIKFETEKYAAENKLSIQEAARELRYKWFEEQRKQLKCSYIAVAHNADDVIETFHINTLRGGGIKALRSIKPKNGKIIRPLLSFFRKEIEAYAINNSISWRTDSSNLKTKYLRNKLRIDIIPQFEAIKPSYKKNLFATISKLHEVEIIYNEYLRATKNEIFAVFKDEIRINSVLLLQKVAPKTLIFELIKPFGFNSKQSLQIFESLHGEPGRTFSSKTHQLFIERNFISIIQQKKIEYMELIIPEFTIKVMLSENTSLQFKKIEKEDFMLEKTKNKAFFDADKLKFPLKIRYFKPGDSFQPFGMEGEKKLSDFFIDQKFTSIQKKDTPLLISDEKIAWVINHRTDERFKVNEATVDVLIIEIISTFRS
ncbi:MAG TPA: tRNA lysidine(34) synthetase TilS [Bacteroidales bacterium]|nr:tRNA lysidine(34) synthetase TilS [Bacteroidales bacterium]